MAELRAADVAAALVRKGMTRDPSHHNMFAKTVVVGDYNVELHTRISHGTSLIPDKVIAAMARQCALRKAEFLALVDCSFDELSWDQTVRGNCPGGFNPYVAPARELLVREPSSRSAEPRRPTRKRRRPR
ncbi:MAG TPA: hypothetical protein VNF75_07415 [Candidatus Dormibacteraeota bacterium]|nr:hypothetical protein [Candidatus Dormibacteraeota bacterium]